MTYNNNTQKAIFELEKQRLGNYGYDFCENNNEFECSECRNTVQTLYRINDKILCGDCICEEIRDKMASLQNIENDSNIDVNTIVYDIISDCSDSELLGYVDEIYERVV